MPDAALFHDPVHDGATDPTVIRHRGTGRHGDVVVDGDSATLYYFTHPHWDGSELDSVDAMEARRSAIFAAPLSVVRGVLLCDRDRPIFITN